MSQKLRLLDVFEGKRHLKIVLTISLFTFLVLELLIYLAAASQAGQKSRVIITNDAGVKVYETSGTALTSYEKYVFESSFGPLSRYHMQLQTDEFPFPLRAWISAAVGIPVALVLLVSFVVRVYLTLVYGDDKEQGDADAADDPSQKKRHLGSLFFSTRHISIFHIGFLVVIGVLLFWIVPNFLQDFVKISITAIREYKWFFLGTAVFFASLIVWMIYLRYRLSKKMLENQLDLEKFRVERQLLVQKETPALLTNQMSEAKDP
jgi:amino acid transporter